MQVEDKYVYFFYILALYPGTICLSKSIKLKVAYFDLIILGGYSL